MAEVVDSIPKRGKYPWDQWLDGRAWKLKRGEDFTTAVDVLRNSIYVAAARRGIKVSTRAEGECLYIKAENDAALAKGEPR